MPRTTYGSHLGRNRSPGRLLEKAAGWEHTSAGWPIFSGTGKD